MKYHTILTKNSNINLGITYPSGEKMKKKISLIIILLLIVLAVLWIFWPRPPPAIAISHIYSVTPGQTIEVEITISNVCDLSGWAVDLAWDPYILEVTTGDPEGVTPIGSTISYNIYEGPFLKSIRPTSFLVNEVNNEHGEIRFLSAIYLEQGENPSGSGVLATINFTCIRAGTTTIEITESIIQDGTGQSISHTIKSGLVTENEPPPIWTNLWFQTNVIIVEVIVLTVVSSVIIFKRKRP